MKKSFNFPKTISILIGFFYFASLFGKDEAFIKPIFGKQISESDKQSCTGIRLDNVGLKQGLTCISVNEKNELIVGEDHSGNRSVVLVNINSNKKQILKTYPTNDMSSEFSGMSQENLLMLVQLGKYEPIQLVVLEYLINFAGGKYDETATFAEVFILKGDSVLMKTDSFKIAQTEVALYRNTDPKFRYLYLSPTDNKGLQPASLSNAKLLFADINGDDYLDMLIWERLYHSRPVEKNETEYGKYGPDFQLHSETMSVRFFDPKSEKFNEPIMNQEIPKPDPILWETLPTLNPISPIFIKSYTNESHLFESN